jgi:CitMHS family citrate-Mg2+:H+ or citrate-Ca2+:H+ symporter
LTVPPPLPVLFMIGFAIAMLINYPDMKEQKARIASHAPNVLAVTSLIFAAGIFTGILSGTGMVEAMARSVTAVIPDGAGRFLPLITALVSIPFTFFISNDAFYFGILPILAEPASSYGISPAWLDYFALPRTGQRDSAPGDERQESLPGAEQTR